MMAVRCPLYAETHGAIRVRGTRATLDTIVTASRAGATAEEIAQKFPTAALADVYQVIAHHLNHTTEIDAYLSEREAHRRSPEVQNRKVLRPCRRSRSPAGASQRRPPQTVGSVLRHNDD
jgi:uncharacterized protein (DUF433 family)